MRFTILQTRSFTFFCVTCLVAMFVLSRWAPEFYSEITQEDDLIEVGTVWLFATAAVIGLRSSLIRRSLPEALIASFCFFAAGEEINWGQRQLGFMPPEYFLQHNLQQEFSLHNFFGPDFNHLVFAVALMVPFLLVPLLATHIKFLPRIGFDVPSKSLMIWSVLLLAIYMIEPVHLASEWAELLIAGLFCARAIESTPLQARTLMNTAIGVLLAVIIGSLTLSVIRNRAASTQQVMALAEVEKLLAALKNGAATPKLFQIEGSAHRRLFGAGASEFVSLDQLEFNPTDFEPEQRRKYFVDPWGMSYWFFVRRNEDGTQTLAVYSLGPNRRRDLNEFRPDEDDDRTDDIVASVTLPAR